MAVPVCLLWVVGLALVPHAVAQNGGKAKKEGRPPLPYTSCSAKLCKSNVASVTLEASLRHVQENGGGKTCYKASGVWDDDLCPDVPSCASNCEIASVTAAEYTDRYGVKPLARGLQLRYVTETAKTQNYGSRVFMMHEKDRGKYKLFKLKNREISITVDASKLPCGLRGAVYLVAMDEEGSKIGGNNAGAKYGTGYCDAQCPKDVKYIQGEVNVLDWQDDNGRMVGRFGSCCSEIDLWEGNGNAMSFGARPCQMQLAKRCKGKQCPPQGHAAFSKNGGMCDPTGCDFNPFRLGAEDFYGPGETFTIDSSHAFTVLTQFITSDGTDDGDLVEIRHTYYQNGEEIGNAVANFGGAAHGDSITEPFCRNQRRAFGEVEGFAKRGGLRRLGAVLDKGMVLVMAIQDDVLEKNMWLDSTFPEDAADSPGAARGPCQGGDESDPEALRSNFADAQVTFTRITYGELGTTASASRQLDEGNVTNATIRPSTTIRSSTTRLTSQTFYP